MPQTLRNEFGKYLTYENLMKAHRKSQSGKRTRKNIVRFNLKQEEYIMWLYEKLIGVNQWLRMAVLRGGSFNNEGSNNPLSNRNGNNTTSNTNINIGFRVVL